MDKLIHKILFILALSIVAVPAVAMDDNGHVQVEQDNQTASISYDGSKVTVKNAEGCSLTIYDITGKPLVQEKVASQSFTLSLANLPKGYYIVKVGNISRKVYVSNTNS